MAGRRYSFIYTKVRELGFDSLATYLVVRRIIEQRLIEEMADECQVRSNTMRAHLAYYGIKIEVDRHRPQSNRKGVELVCTSCSTPKYYSPAQRLRLNPTTYKCRKCYGNEASA